MTIGRNLTCLIPLLWAHAALGEVVFSSFGTNNSFDTQVGLGVSWHVTSAGWPLNSANGIASAFTIGSEGISLASVSIAIGCLGDAAAETNISFSIVADNNGMPNGPVVEVLAAHPSNIASYFQAQIVTYTSSLNPIMAAGEKFWLVAEPVDLNQNSPNDNATFAWFNGVTPGFHAFRDFDFEFGSWNSWSLLPPTVSPAFCIEGTLVPEPSALWLLLGGLGSLGNRVWRRRA